MVCDCVLSIGRSIYYYLIPIYVVKYNRNLCVAPMNSIPQTSNTIHIIFGIFAVFLFRWSGNRYTKLMRISHTYVSIENYKAVQVLYIKRNFQFHFYCNAVLHLVRNGFTLWVMRTHNLPCRNPVIFFYRRWNFWYMYTNFCVGCSAAFELTKVSIVLAAIRPDRAFATIQKLKSAFNQSMQQLECQNSRYVLNAA